MSQLYDQIVSQRGSFERLLARIPGFKGYIDKETRREADRMLRDYLVGRMAQRIRRMADLERRILDLNGGLSYMSKTSRTKAKLQLYRDKLNAVTPGFSAFMEAVKIKADELDKLYAFDEAQIRYIDSFDSGLDALDAAVKGHAAQTASAPSQSDALAPISIEDALETLNASAEEAINALALRDDVVTDLASTTKSKFA